MRRLQRAAPRPHPLDFILSETRAELRRFASLYSDQRLRSVYWVTRIERDAIHFDFRLSTRGFFWELDCRDFNCAELFQVLQQVGQGPFIALWDEVVREARDNRFTIRPGVVYRTVDERVPLPDNPMLADAARAMQAQIDVEVARAFSVDTNALVEGPALTATEVRARYIEAARLLQRDRTHPAARTEADLRGEKLLREWLSPEQRAQYLANQHFDVRGEATGKRYRLVREASFNVIELDDAGRERARLCFLPAGGLVMGDQLLAQKVALETDERAALRVANRDAGGFEPQRLFIDGGPCTCAACRQGFRPAPAFARDEIIYGGRALRWAAIDEAADWIPQERRVAAPPPVLVPRSERIPDPNSWMANWGSMGTDLLAAREQGSSSRRGRRRR